MLIAGHGIYRDPSQRSHQRRGRYLAMAAASLHFSLPVNGRDRSAMLRFPPSIHPSSVCEYVGVIAFLEGP